MRVVYKGSSSVLLTDYNGKRYAFYKNIPQEIPHAVYDFMIQAGHVDAVDLAPIELIPVKMEEVSSPEETEKTVSKPQSKKPMTPKRKR